MINGSVQPCDVVASGGDRRPRNPMQVIGCVALRDRRSCMGPGRGDRYARNVRLIVSCAVLR
jgi:hypothetical protein